MIKKVNTVIVIVVGALLLSGCSLEDHGAASGTIVSVDGTTNNVNFVGEKGVEVFANSDAQIEIPVVEIQSQTVHFFNHKLKSGKVVYFMIYKDSSGVIRAAANANAQCASMGKGYKVEGENLICNNCPREIYLASDIGLSGSDCSPVSISSGLAVSSEAAIIDVALLDGVSGLF